MAQSAAQRRAAQRRTAKALERGEKPLGGQYQKYVVSSLRRQAIASIRAKVSHRPGYDDNTVVKAVNQVMSMDQIRWTIGASENEIRSRASEKTYIGIFENEDRNPWWYHRW